MENRPYLMEGGACWFLHTVICSLDMGCLNAEDSILPKGKICVKNGLFRSSLRRDCCGNYLARLYNKNSPRPVAGGAGYKLFIKKAHRFIKKY